MSVHRIALASLCAAACAKSAPPPKNPEPPPKVEAPPPPRPERDDGMSVSGTLGTLGDDEILNAFKSRWPDVTRCSQTAQSRYSYLTGTVQLKLRVGQDGLAKKAYVERSTLGNYAAERCVLDVARAIVFPAPRGGAEAEFLFPIEVKPRPSSPYVTAWEEARIAPTVERSKVDVGVCRGAPEPVAKNGKKGKHAVAAKAPAGPLKELPPGLLLTLYVAPGGKVSSAGLAADGPIDDELASCIIDRTKGWKLDDPRGQVAKATFEVAP